MVGAVSAAVVMAGGLGGCIIVAVDRDESHSFRETKARTIGVDLADVGDGTAAQAGVDGSRACIVTRVAANSPAERAGLKRWDIITHIDGKDWARTSAVRESVRAAHDGQAVKFTVVREGKPVEVSVIPEKD
jgi:S1-C subfamily serine protease